jgi:hypothetical protein
MKTPAQIRREAALAQKAAATEPKAKAQHANAYELMLAKLDSDKRALKRLQSLERKIAAKARMLPEYEAWIDGVLKADSGMQDDVLTTLMVWRIDASDFEGALPLAEYALRHKLALPDNYARTLACLVAEEVAEAALKAFSLGQAFDLAILEKTADLTFTEDMPDEVRAKLYKARGYAEEAAGKPAYALESLTEALRLNAKAGVKKDIERLIRAVKNSAA